MPTVFKFNWAFVSNLSKYNLAEGLDLKKPILYKFFYYKIMSFFKIFNEIKKKDTWYVADAHSIYYAT